MFFSSSTFPRTRGSAQSFALLAAASMLAALSGCGGGYVGGTVPTMAASHIVIDSGQSFMAVANNPQNLPMAWSLTGPQCTGSGCGVVSQTSNTGAMYTAPQVSQQSTMRLDSTVMGTSRASSTSITVNIAPRINGAPPDGVVGSAYSAAFALSGGTPGLKWQPMKGSLPAGLSFDVKSGLLTGTPTAAGASTFTLQAVDSSDVPQTFTATYTVNVVDASAPAANNPPVNNPPASNPPVNSPPVNDPPSNPPVNTPGNPAVTLTAVGFAPDGVVNVPYATVLVASGGTAPYTWSIASGSLPAGLSLSAAGVISGAPTLPGNYALDAQVMDAAGAVKTLHLAMHVLPAPQIPVLTLTNTTLPSGTVGVAYAADINVTGGVAPFACELDANGVLPQGLALAANCTVTGVPSVAGTYTFPVKMTDAGAPAIAGTSSVTIVVNPAPVVLTVLSPADAIVAVPYSAPLPVSGGTAPYTCSVLTGSVPLGLTLGSDCVLHGLPLLPGAAPLKVRVTDSANPADTTDANITVTVNLPVVTLALTDPPVAMVGTPYTGSVTVVGGTAPYTCALASGNMPSGLTLGADCSVTGTPAAAGVFTVGITVTDSASPANTKAATVNITVLPAPVTLTLAAPPVATVNVPYNGTIVVTGGTAPYTCSAAAGAMPAGLSLGANCTFTGTPVAAGKFNVNVTATDGANPVNTKTGAVSITVQSPLVTLTLTAPPVAVVGTPYIGAILVAGGTAPYSCSVASGAMPAGLNLNANCTITGTPTAAGTFNVAVTAADSASPANTKTSNVNVTVQPALVTLTLAAPPAAVVGTPYVGAVLVAGGAAPYSCSVASGTMPAGLNLNANCTITGTPTAAGTFNVGVTATDSANPANTKTANVSITVAAAPVVLTLTTPPVGVVNVPYLGALLPLGGTAPYTCAVASGSLPAGISLGNNCVLTGTPTAAGTSAVRIAVTDSASPANTTNAQVTITVLAPAATLSLNGSVDATVNLPLTAPISITGGTAPYACSASGAVPAGLTLNANCTITGTATAAGTFHVNVQATDAGTPMLNGSVNLTITVHPAATLTLTGTLPAATVGTAYTQTLQAAGGVGPYTYSYTGALPAGLSFSTGGVLSGTPTAAGAVSFTVTATDSEPVPQTASLQYTLPVNFPAVASDALLHGPYAFLLEGYDDVASGVLAYRNATVGSFNADGSGVLTAGELDSNHQGAATVAVQSMLGTYTLGADGRGTVVITTMQPDGSAGAVNSYAVSLKLPAGNATASTGGSLTETDGNLLVGTKATGTLMAQDASAFSNALNGNYAFGLSGDTPCLPSCTVGIAAGPAVSVGQFNAANGTVSGTGDANIGSTNFASSALSGSFSTADNNGRVQLTLNSAKLASVPFPTHYAVYVVDATHALLVSTDKHTDYVLQAGTAQLQTAGAALTGAYVGYENAPVNPGLVNMALSNVLNLSSATVFRGTANGGDTCNTTNVDMGGLTGLVSSLRSLGGNTGALTALLGTYGSTGNSSCTVATDGRAVMAYPHPGTALSTTLGLLGLSTAPPAARVAYLTGNNEGYFLETGYAALGHLEAQAAGPFTLGWMHGSYAYGTVAPASLASIAGSGSMTADGAGHLASTLDTNVGVGNANLLQLGVTGTSTYSLADATAGRFSLSGSRTAYALSMGRFVVIDTNAASTAPYMGLMY